MKRKSYVTSTVFVDTLLREIDSPAEAGERSVYSVHVQNARL